MNSRHLLPQALNFIIFFIIQILVVRKLVLFDVAFCYVYVAFLLLLPIEINVIAAMILGFATGLLVDIFYNTFGIHAAACVFIMYIRKLWIDFLTPRGGYEMGSIPSPRSQGIQWFMTYAFPLLLIHHMLIFFIEIGGFQLFSYTALKALASTAFSLIMILVIQYIIYSSSRRNVL
ncbi:MAG: Rod shape-determining protein MreD [Cyclobacteriaceae bacterium]